MMNVIEERLGNHDTSGYCSRLMGRYLSHTSSIITIVNIYYNVGIEDQTWTFDFKLDNHCYIHTRCYRKMHPDNKDELIMYFPQKAFEEFRIETGITCKLEDGV